MDALLLITVQEMQQVPELIWMWWLKNKSTTMPGTEPQVAQCHIHITELFQHSDYMQKCSNLYTANAVLLHCSLPGLIKLCILISSKKLPLTLFSLQDKTNNSLFGEEGKTITHHWSNSITTWSKEYACHNDKMTKSTQKVPSSTMNESMSLVCCSPYEVWSNCSKTDSVTGI